ncbi:hypothetical protein AYO24_10455 (plasmid) [Coxiella burnetii]|nr:hypothetical protein AYO24_10455 [Coxiella burnetii]ATN84978.1 hypothetical protein AYO23_10380 [Coxiella burnetii]
MKKDKNGMDKIKPIPTRHKPNAQKKYRRSQANKGLVRFELQVRADAKKRFEAMVQAAAEEYPEPWNERQRMAKARARIFEEITQGTLHEFFTLKEEIERLKEEVKTLSPQFFQSENIAPTPLPEAIRSLPDNPQQLKAILAKIYQTGLQAQLAVKEYKRRAEQYLKLYEAASNSNEELKSRLKKEQDVTFED